MHKLMKLFPLVGALLALAFVSCGSDSDDGSEAAAQQKTAGSISYATTSVEKTTADGTFTNELTKTGDGTVTYTSDNTAVATVNEDGEVTIKGTGEATITATVADSDTYTYATKTASYTLTVTQASPLNLNLKTGGAIHSILVQLCPGSGTDSSACTKFARSETNNEKATLYLDTEEKYIPVWSVDTEVYYYVPDGCTPVMNEDSSKMFYVCSELTRVDVSSFDTSKVTNMLGMFAGCSGLTSLDVTGFDTSKVTNMSGMFLYCSGLTNLDVTGFNTSNVTNMSSMFASCSKLTGLDLSKFDTSNVTDMSSMFYCCSEFTSLDLSKFDTSNVTDMSSMFASCSKLTSLDLSKFDTSKVTDMSSMFCFCSGLTSLDLSKFDTGNVMDMSYMFASCKKLTSLDVTGFDTSNVTDMDEMFYGCEGLTSLDLSSFDTSNVTFMEEMFYGCEGLTIIYVTDKFVTTNVTSDNNCFYKCSKLVGGAGTTYDSSKVSADYARIDGGTDSASPGYFTAKPIGSKSKPDAVGDIVFSDGSAVPYSADLTLTAEQKAAAIAVIFDADKKLGVGLVQGTNLAWAKSGTTGHGDIATLSATKDSSGINVSDAKFSGDGANDGSENLTNFRTVVGVNSSGKLDSNDYPAWAWIEDYATNASLAETSYESGWYMPSIKELCDLYKVKETVNNSIGKTDGIQMSTGQFWSSSQGEKFAITAWTVAFSAGLLSTDNNKANSFFVCAVRAFN